MTFSDTEMDLEARKSTAWNEKIAKIMGEMRHE